jgi:hypothetical protein
MAYIRKVSPLFLFCSFTLAVICTVQGVVSQHVLALKGVSNSCGCGVTRVTSVKCVCKYSSSVGFRRMDCRFLTSEFNARAFQYRLPIHWPPSDACSWRVAADFSSRFVWEVPRLIFSFRVSREDRVAHMEIRMNLLLKPNGHYTYRQVEHSASLRSAHTVYLRVLCGSENKQRLHRSTHKMYP